MPRFAILSCAFALLSISFFLHSTFRRDRGLRGVLPSVLCLWFVYFPSYESHCLILLRTARDRWLDKLAKAQASQLEHHKHQVHAPVEDSSTPPPLPPPPIAPETPRAPSLPEDTLTVPASTEPSTPAPPLIPRRCANEQIHGDPRRSFIALDPMTDGTPRRLSSAAALARKASDV